MAYGSPASLDDMEAYLLDVREGRPPSPELVKEMKQRYGAIGGSPLNRLTQEQATALQQALARRGTPRPVYVGMRHWPPRIAETVAHMQADGIEEAAALVMAPHYSAMSIGRYKKKLDEAVQQLGSPIRFHFILSWSHQPNFIRAWAEALKPLLAEGTKVVFSAHSLPERIRQMNDPYEQNLRESAARIAESAGVTDWSFAFQSAGATAEPWLGPALEAELPELARAGCKRVVVAPIGFVCDHVEVLFDIDIEAREIAQANGITLVRAPSMNTHPTFIEAIADAVGESW